jgi:hypothetical protein
MFIGHSSWFSDFLLFGEVCKISEGTVTAIVFFLKSKEARYRWASLLGGIVRSFGWEITCSQEEEQEDFTLDFADVDNEERPSESIFGAFRYSSISASSVS